jgi:hypothetical protein
MEQRRIQQLTANNRLNVYSRLSRLSRLWRIRSYFEFSLIYKNKRPARTCSTASFSFSESIKSRISQMHQAHYNRITVSAYYIIFLSFDNPVTPEGVDDSKANPMPSPMESIMAMFLMSMTNFGDYYDAFENTEHEMEAKVTL